MECIFCGKRTQFYVFVERKKVYICERHEDMLCNISEEDLIEIINKTINGFLEMQKINIRFEKAIERLRRKSYK